MEQVERVFMGKFQWSWAELLVPLPAHANSVHWMCMSVDLIPADCRVCPSVFIMSLSSGQACL